MNQPQEIYSPGLEGVIAGETAVSTITEGLTYRGYAVEELADRASFEECAYLLLHGELPNQTQLARLRERLAEAMRIPDPVRDLLRALPPNTTPMDSLRTGVSALAHWDPETADDSHEANVRKTERLLAQIPVLMTTAWRFSRGQEPIGPDPSLTIAGNLLWMLQGEKPTPRAVKSMDVTLVLYAEHEFNASTFTARVVCSTLSDLHSSITAAIGALKGPLHGGANERVMEVLEEVGSADRAERWIRDALAQKRRIMGFGHRVYKHGDPRATYLKPLCAELAREKGFDDMERMADVIESVVRHEKKLPPNADWPSARLYHYLGLPIPLYTPLFVASRTSGWGAHVIEQLDNNRLIRPRSRYVGPATRPFVPLSDR